MSPGENVWYVMKLLIIGSTGEGESLLQLVAGDRFIPVLASSTIQIDRCIRMRPIGGFALLHMSKHPYRITGSYLVLSSALPLET
jgi:hypothetical protein